MQYDRVACSCHTASALLSGQKHWKCDCHRGPFYKVAAMLTMATRPAMGSPLRWVSASSGFTLSIFTCEKIPLITRPALTSKMEFGGPIMPEHCIGMFSCNPFCHSSRYQMLLLVEDRIPAPGPPRMQLVEFLECLNTIMVETYIEWLLSRLCAAVKQALNSK